ncbi:glutaredoxin family protein [Mycolicibacterium fortuitum]
MNLTITILSQPTCQPCKFIKRQLTEAGIAYQERNVVNDPAAADLLTGIYARLRPGKMPHTPVTLIGESEIVFGPLVLDRLREVQRSEAA